MIQASLILIQVFPRKTGILAQVVGLVNFTCLLKDFPILNMGLHRPEIAYQK